MFDRLIDLLFQIKDRVLPLTEVSAYEHAALLRFGRLKTVLAPGWHFKIPFVDDAIHVYTCTTTMRLLPQSLTTKDGIQVVVSAVVKYHIEDAGLYVCSVTDQVDALADIAAGKIAEAVEEASFEDFHQQRPTLRIASRIRAQVKKYGFHLEELTITDFGRVRSFRLIQPSPVNIAN